MFSRRMCFQFLLVVTFLWCWEGACGIHYDSADCREPGVTDEEKYGNVQELCTAVCGGWESIQRCQVQAHWSTLEFIFARCTCRHRVNFIGNYEHHCTRVESTECFDCTNNRLKIPVCTSNRQAKGFGD